MTVSGGLVWKRHLSAEAVAGIYRGNGELFRDAYREGIWKSKINLSFLTHSNQDEFAHKSFEIAACEGFLLAERSEGHLQRFIEDEEAVFFSTIEECVEKIRRYLPDEAARSRIAAAGRAAGRALRISQRPPSRADYGAGAGDSSQGKGRRRLMRKRTFFVLRKGPSKHHNLH